MGMAGPFDDAYIALGLCAILGYLLTILAVVKLRRPKLFARLPRYAFCVVYVSLWNAAFGIAVLTIPSPDEAAKTLGSFNLIFAIILSLWDAVTSGDDHAEDVDMEKQSSLLNVAD